MAYSLIACDMDETLLNDDHQIGQQNIDAIRKARDEYGVKFVPATGRGYLSIQHDLVALGLHDLADEYVISFNGGALTENKGNRLLRFNGIGFEAMRDIFHYGLGADVCIRVYTQDHVFVYNVSASEAERIQNQKQPCTIMDENTVDFLAHASVAKIVFQNMDQTYLRALEAEMSDLVNNRFAVTYSSNRYLEFNALGVDKGRGLSELSSALGIDLSQTIAVGDNFNDVPMMQVAGLSVAANNAAREIKDLCDYVTVADNNQGVLHEVISTFIFGAKA